MGEVTSETIEIASTSSFLAHETVIKADIQGGGGGVELHDLHLLFSFSIAAGLEPEMRQQSPSIGI